MKSIMMAAILALTVFALPITGSFHSDHAKNALTFTVEKTVAFAEEVAAPAATPAVEAPTAVIQEAAAPTAPTFLDAILNWIAGSGAFMTALAMVFEFLMRLYPTKKPLSLLIPVKYVAVSLGAIFSFLGNFVDVLIEKANSVK